MPADVNGDGAIDFVVPYPNDGPDRERGTGDDSAVLMTLLNTASAGPGRCGAVNRPPSSAAVLADRRLARDGTLNVDVSSAFVDPDGHALTYAVSSSAPRVVQTRAAGAVHRQRNSSCSIESRIVHGTVHGRRNMPLNHCK